MRAQGVKQSVLSICLSIASNRLAMPVSVTNIYCLLLTTPIDCMPCAFAHSHNILVNVVNCLSIGTHHACYCNSQLDEDADATRAGYVLYRTLIIISFIVFCTYRDDNSEDIFVHQVGYIMRFM